MASSFESVLASIPGYGGFAAKKRMNEQDERADFAQGISLAKLAEAIRARQGEESHRAATLEAGTQDRAVSRALQRQQIEDSFAARMSQIDATYAQIAQNAANAEQRAQVEQRRIEEQANARKRHDEILLLLGREKNERAAKSPQAKPPTGFRFTADGNLEPIPGGPKDTAPKDLARAKGAVQKADTVINSVNEALTQTGRFTTGLPGQVLGMIPGTPAYDLDGTLDTIKANLGFAELQAMREASPTGGALGQVAIQELAMLQSTLASLKRGLSRDKLESGLKQVKTHMENWKKAVTEANQGSLDAPQPPPAPPEPTPAPAAPGGSWTPEKQRRLEELQRKLKGGS